MPLIVTADRAVASVTATGSDDWQVVSTPTGFRGITSADFSDNDKVAGFCLFENGVDYEVYDTLEDDASTLLEITNITGTVTISRPATPYKSSNGGLRVNAGSGTHTLVIGMGSGTAARLLRETNPTWKTFASGDATPSVAGYRLFKTTDTTTITAFDDMEAGKVFFVTRGNADISIADGAGISLPNNENLVLTPAQPSAVFVEDGGVAVLVSVSGNKLLDANATVFANSDATPSVADKTTFQIAATPPAAITTFDDMRDGQKIIVQPGAQDQVFTHSANFKMPGGVDFTLFSDGGPVQFYKENGVIYMMGAGGISGPASSVDGRLSVFSGTSGRQLNQSSVGEAVLLVAPNIQAISELTISSGAVVPTRAHHTVDTEADASSDDLDTITLTNLKAGDEGVLGLENAARVVTIRHGAGNITTPDGLPIVMDSLAKTVRYRVNAAGTGVYAWLSYGVSMPTLTQLAGLSVVGFTEGAVIRAEGAATAFDGGGGDFIATTSDISALVTADTDGAVAIASSHDATGASGGFVRREYHYSRQIYVDWWQPAKDGSTDDSGKFQQAFDVAEVNGGKVRISAAEYAFASRATLDLTGFSADGDEDGVTIEGDGSACTGIKYTGVVATEPCFEILGGTGAGLHLHLTIAGIKFQTTTAQTGVGIRIENGAFFRLFDVFCLSLFRGFEGVDVLSCRFFDFRASFCDIGADFSQDDGSKPNAIDFYGCVIGGGLSFGIRSTGGSQLSLFGGSIEGNGTQDANEAGIFVQDSGQQGAVAVTCEGVYFEGQGGLADIWISTGTNATSACVTGCNFNRVGTTKYSKYNIRIDQDAADGEFVLFVAGNGFQGFGGYVPDATRPYIKTFAAATFRIVDGGNLWGSDTEKPTNMRADFFGLTNYRGMNRAVGSFAQSPTAAPVIMGGSASGLDATVGAGQNSGGTWGELLLVSQNTERLRVRADGKVVSKLGLGMYDTVPPTSQPAAIADSTDATVTEYRDKINSILAALRALGAIDT